MQRPPGTSDRLVKRRRYRLIRRNRWPHCFRFRTVGCDVVDDVGSGGLGFAPAAAFALLKGNFFRARCAH
jgi:hypothetical protein